MSAKASKTIRTNSATLPSKRSRIRIAILPLLAIAVAGVVVWIWWRPAPVELVSKEGAALSAAAVRPVAGKFAGMETCRECHADKVEAFSKTSHALSMQIPDQSRTWGDFTPGKNIMRTRRPDLWYEVNKNEQGMFQTSFEGTPQGMQRTTQHVDLVMGSGKLALAYMYWQGDQLFQMPLVFFIPLDTWTNAPGFSDRFAWWDRPITPRCLECHATYFEHLPGTNNSYRKDNYIAAISCERCHGRGADHVEYHREHSDAKRGERIIDPRLLSRARQLDNCALCHGAVGHPIEPSFSYVAGEPLTSSFRFDTHAGDASLVHTINQLDRLSQSMCFQKSAAMTCTTCHDPHVHERGDTQQFSDRCIECHQTADHPRAAELGPQLITNCIDCHMPLKDDQSLAFKTSTGDKLRLVQLRDHLIDINQERSDEVLDRWKSGEPDLSSEQRLQKVAQLRMAAAKTAHAQTLLQAGKREDARRFLDEALSVKGDFAPALTGIGVLLMADGDAAGARKNLTRAIELDDKNVPALVQLARIDYDDRNLRSAIDRLNRALRIEPDNSAANNLLAWLLATADQVELRDSTQAVQLAELACHSSGNQEPGYLDTLGAAYAAAGRFEDAARVASLAIEKFRAASLSDRAAAVEKRRTLYRAGQPYVDVVP